MVLPPSNICYKEEKKFKNQCKYLSMIKAHVITWAQLIAQNYLLNLKSADE